MLRRHFHYQGRIFRRRRGVFDPKRHLSGLAFAELLEEAFGEFLPGTNRAQVWDLGTGSGILAWEAARLGARVVATDVSSRAVENAAENCKGHDIEVRQGDLFDPVWGEWFDLVIVNPPYEQGDPGSDAEGAFVSRDFLERFGAEIGQFTNRVLLAFPADDEAAIERTGLDFHLWRRVETSGEDLGLFVWKGR